MLSPLYTGGPVGSRHTRRGSRLGRPSVTQAPSRQDDQHDGDYPPKDRRAWRAASLAPSRPWASPVARALVGVTARATPPASTIARAIEANNTVFLILRGRFFGGAGEEISRSPATQRKHHNRTRASAPPPPGLASINFGELRHGEVRRKHFLERWAKREESTVASRRASKGLQPHCPSCYDQGGNVRHNTIPPSRGIDARGRGWALGEGERSQ